MIHHPWQTPNAKGYLGDNENVDEPGRWKSATAQYAYVPGTSHRLHRRSIYFFIFGKVSYFVEQCWIMDEICLCADRFFNFIAPIFCGAEPRRINCEHAFWTASLFSSSQHLSRISHNWIANQRLRRMAWLLSRYQRKYICSFYSWSIRSRNNPFFFLRGEFLDTLNIINSRKGYVFWIHSLGYTEPAKGVYESLGAVSEIAQVRIGLQLYELIGIFYLGECDWRSLRYRTNFGSWSRYLPIYSY